MSNIWSEYDRQRRMIKRVLAGIALAAVATLGVVGYIAWHFISKFW